MTAKVWMKPPGGGEPQEIDCGTDTHMTLVPLMVKGWRQCDPPAAGTKKKKEVTGNG